jgi:hypothetical protein
MAGEAGEIVTEAQIGTWDAVCGLNAILATPVPLLSPIAYSVDTGHLLNDEP